MRIPSPVSTPGVWGLGPWRAHEYGQHLLQQATLTEWCRFVRFLYQAHGFVEVPASQTGFEGRRCCLDLVLGRDQAWACCSPAELEEELQGFLSLQREFHRALDWTVAVELSLPIGSAHTDVVRIVREALARTEWPVLVSREAREAGGIKLAFHIGDAMGRSFELGNLTVHPLGHKISHTLAGPWEDVLGLLHGHWAGAWPLWLAPEQVRVLPLGAEHLDWAREATRHLLGSGFRATCHEEVSSGPLKARVADATAERVPYVAVIGSREVDSHTLSVRPRGGTEGFPLELEAFLARLEEERQERRPRPTPRGEHCSLKTQNEAVLIASNS